MEHAISRSDHGEEDTITICVAAISDDGKGVVCVADAMVTAEYPLAITMEQSPKIITFAEDSVVMTAGNALGHTELIDDAMARLESLQMKRPTVRQYCELIKEAYLSLRKKKVEELYLSPRGLTLEDEAGGLYARRMNPEVLAMLDRKIEEFDYNLDVLLAGVDRKGAHIYEIADPGTSACFDRLGFDAIGIGNIHAMHSLISDNYDPSFPKDRALACVVKAKRMAERAPGVGTRTGVCYVSDNGVEFFKQEEIQAVLEI